LQRESGAVKGKLSFPLPGLAATRLLGITRGPVPFAGDEPLAGPPSGAAGIVNGKLAFVAGKVKTLRDVDLIFVVAGETRDRTLKTCRYGNDSERHDLVQQAIDADIVA